MALALRPHKDVAKGYSEAGPGIIKADAETMVIFYGVNQGSMRSLKSLFLSVHRQVVIGRCNI